MSNVNTQAAAQEKLGEFYKYDSALPPAEYADSRIVKLIVRNPAGTAPEKMKESKYVRIPHTITEDIVLDNAEELLPYFVDYLQSIEDKLIKLDFDKGVACIHTEYLGLDKVIGYLEEQDSSSRLNGETIAAWFTAEVAPSILDTLVSKHGTGNMKILEGAVAAYLAKFTSLASPKTQLAQEDKEALERAMQISNAGESVIGKRIARRLEGMKQREVDMLLAL